MGEERGGQGGGGGRQPMRGGGGRGSKGRERKGEREGKGEETVRGGTEEGGTEEGRGRRMVERVDGGVLAPGCVSEPADISETRLTRRVSPTSAQRPNAARIWGDRRQFSLVVSSWYVHPFEAVLLHGIHSSAF